MISQPQPSVLIFTSVLSPQSFSLPQSSALSPYLLPQSSVLSPNLLPQSLISNMRPYLCLINKNPQSSVLSPQSSLLITGGAGFIGANFVHYWIKNYPDDRVIVLDALTYAGNRANLAPVENHPGFHFVHGDIRDYDLVMNLLQDHQIDTIVHFAAESHVDRSIHGPDAFVDTNILGTHTLLKAAKTTWLDKSSSALKSQSSALSQSSAVAYADSQSAQQSASRSISPVLSLTLSPQTSALSPLPSVSTISRPTKSTGRSARTTPAFLKQQPMHQTLPMLPARQVRTSWCGHITKPMACP